MWHKTHKTHFLLMFLFGLVLLSSSYDLDKQPKTYTLKVGEDNEELEETQEDTKCWRYTWLGPVEDDSNATDTTSCDNSPQNDGVPCFEPIVWTVGPNKNNQPNLTDLEVKCSSGQGTQGQVCDPFCLKSDGDVCIKMTYFHRDSAKSVEKTVSFCGKAVELTEDNAAITDGCMTQENKDGYDVEACFCITNRCNSAMSHHLSLVFLPASMLLLLAIRLHSVLLL